MMKPEFAKKISWREFLDTLISTELPRHIGENCYGGDIAELITATIRNQQKYWDNAQAHTQFLATHQQATGRWWSDNPDLAASINPFTQPERLMATMIGTDVPIRLHESTWIVTHDTQQVTLDQTIITTIMNDLSIRPARDRAEEILAVLDQGTTIFEKADSGYYLRGTSLEEGQKTVAVTKDGTEHEVIVGPVTDLGDGTFRADFTDAHPLDMSDTLEEGHIVFMNTPAGYQLHAVSLEEGSLVAVTTKSGENKYVIVGSVTDLADGTQTASFTFAPAFRRSHGDGERWIVTGQNLREGEEILVPKKDGTMSRIKVGRVQTGKNGLDRATFTSLDRSHRHAR